MEMLMKFVAIWSMLVVIAMLLILMTKNGYSNLSEYFFILYTCNLFSGLLVMLIMWSYMPFTIIESIARIIKENPMR